MESCDTWRELRLTPLNQFEVMKPEEQNAVIHESLGWVRKSGSEIDGPCGKEIWAWTSWTRNGVETGCPYDYHGSLDACREFENDAPHEYWMELKRVTHCGIHSNPFSMMVMFARATSAQRCEAKIRQLGKWPNPDSSAGEQTNRIK